MKNTFCLKYQHEKHTLYEKIRFWLILGGRHTATIKDTNLILDTLYAKLSTTKSQKTAIIPSDLER